MINVFLNNKSLSIETESSLYDFLMHNEQLKDYVAVTVNNTLVARRDFNTTFLKANDCVDVLIPMQGG
ncbi:sulfur carrier protein ThiS [Rickettsiella endosymbiont of Rhagonycha lignosa]|uniref:sulfur carrier protein ThiS n=1 Tax=Rickettsiella endosymbiont of Rhagonycha lignosa TaxID=3077937 RepID=UPI00313D34B4